MAIVFEFEHWERPASFSSNFTEEEISRTFKIVTNDINDNPFTIVAESSILPVAFEPHPFNAAFLLKTLDIDLIDPDDAFHWIATANYDTFPVEQDQSDPNPLNWETRISWTGRRVPDFRVRDRNNFPVTNSAGDFLSPWDVGRGQEVAHVRKNLPAVPAVIDTLQNTVNQQAFTLDGRIIGPREGLLEDGFTISEPQTVNDITFREVTFNIVWDRLTHDVARLDEGVRVLEDPQMPPTQPGRIRVRNSDGSYSTEPIPLNGSGLRLDSPSPTTAVIIAPDSSGDPTPGLRVQYIEEADWTPLINLF